MNGETTMLGAAPSPLQPLPALNIGELLSARGSKKRALKESELELLGEALAFLDRVQAGKQIIHETIRNGNLTPDIVALDAYEYTRRALQDCVASGSCTLEDNEAIIDEAREVISSLVAHKGKSVSIPSDAVDRVSELFWALAQYAHSRGSIAWMT